MFPIKYKTTKALHAFQLYKLILKWTFQHLISVKIHDFCYLKNFDHTALFVKYEYSAYG